jgi:hypothetical protein
MGTNTAAAGGTTGATGSNNGSKSLNSVGGSEESVTESTSDIHTERWVKIETNWVKKYGVLILESRSDRLSLRENRFCRNPLPGGTKCTRTSRCTRILEPGKVSEILD